MTWKHGGSRRRPLPPDWQKTSRRILRRDPVCKRCGQRPSTEVNHIDPDGPDEDWNLEGLDHDCHAKETARQRWSGRHRPAERHPAER